MPEVRGSRLPVCLVIGFSDPRIEQTVKALKEVRKAERKAKPSPPPEAKPPAAPPRPDTGDPFAMPDHDGYVIAEPRGGTTPGTCCGC